MPMPVNLRHRKMFLSANVHLFKGMTAGEAEGPGELPSACTNIEILLLAQLILVAYMIKSFWGYTAVKVAEKRVPMLLFYHFLGALKLLLVLSLLLTNPHIKLISNILHIAGGGVEEALKLSVSAFTCRGDSNSVMPPFIGPTVNKLTPQWVELRLNVIHDSMLVLPGSQKLVVTLSEYLSRWAFQHYAEIPAEGLNIYGVFIFIITIFILR